MRNFCTLILSLSGDTINLSKAFPGAPSGRRETMRGNHEEEALIALHGWILQCWAFSDTGSGMGGVELGGSSQQCTISKVLKIIFQKPRM